jgi:hypothetical protein
LQTAHKGSSVRGRGFVGRVKVAPNGGHGVAVETVAMKVGRFECAPIDVPLGMVLMLFFATEKKVKLVILPSNGSLLCAVA